MLEKWRLILDKAMPASYNMAKDCALLACSSEKEFLPTLRFYSWQPAALTIGYFQKIEEELNEEVCKKENVPIIRRITGGGAVFHQHEITYSVIIPLSHKLANSKILDSYKILSDPIVETLKSYNLNASFEGINDIVVDDKKISGNAQTRRMGGVLQHGTILLDLETDKMFNYLKVPTEKSKVKSNAKPASRVTALKYLLGEKVLSNDFQNKFIQKIIENWQIQNNIKFETSTLTEKETNLTIEYKENLFENINWNKKRTIEKKSLL